jgi:FHS family L-fucose permease-like MFS transporter
MQELQLDEQNASNYYLASLVLFMASRFVCTWLMQYIKPTKLLVGLSILALIATACVIYFGGYIGVYSLVLISGCMSLMYPTIYGLAISGLGSDTKIASSGLVMAILGGAVLTPIQGLVSDATQSINYAFYIPFISFVIILIYGFFLMNKDRAKA